MIDIKTFSKLDIRVGMVIEAKEFVEAQKPAFQLKLDFGPLGIKWSSAQITEHYSTETLINRRILALVNIAPKKIATFQSEVLVLGVPDGSGAVVLLEPDGAIPTGARVR